ncbi:MAG TPA: helicase-associated domain-containing protein [Clostridiales bacterium]|nr:helicase-associated domain-containing protein [Clostridiales bacterium]
MTLKVYLENMNVTDYGNNSLSKLIKIAGLKGVSTRKAAMVSALDTFLSDIWNIQQTWKALNKYEKEILEEYIRSGRTLDSGDMKAIMEKYGKGVKFFSATKLVDCFSENSPAKLFFLPTHMPEQIYNILKDLVKPLEIRFNPVTEISKENVSYELFIGEQFYQDFVQMIRLVNSNKLKTTKGSKFPTKASTVKINEVLINKEILTDSYIDIENIRTIEQTTRIYGIIQLMFDSGLLEEKNGILALGPEAEKFLKLNYIDKSKELLHTYIDSKNINEIERISEIKVRTYRQPYFKTSRETILRYLSMCPIDQWVERSEFLKVIKRNSRKFILDETGNIESYDDYYRYYTDSDLGFNEIEGRFIDVMLIEYLSALGIVDVMLDEWSSEFYNYSYFVSSYFKLTPMGAYILGVNEGYISDKEIDSAGFGLIVQPNYEILIPEGSMKDLHVIFFDRFAEKISEDKVNIYKLSFKSIITALDNGIGVGEIIEYIKKYCQHDIPENVLITLNEWEQESKRIRIRTVTIVEADSKYLIEELKAYKSISGNIKKELPFIFEIENNASNKVKREIEKKNHFCLLE